MLGMFDVLDNTYKPTQSFSFEFCERNSSTGEVGNSLAELFFLLPPEEYSMKEGYKVTINKTIAGAWVDDFGNDFKEIKLSGSLYSYYIGLPAKTSTMEQSLPPFIRSLKDSALGLSEDLKRLASSSMNPTGLDIPGLDLISGLDEFFKLRYIVSRFRDIKSAKFNNSDQAIIKKFSDLNSLLVKAREGKQLFTDIAVIYHDYDDNNHYEVVFTDFNMGRSQRDPFTVNYSISMTGISEYSNKYLGLGQLKKREEPYGIVNAFVNDLNTLVDEVTLLTSIPIIMTNEVSSMLGIMTVASDATKEIITNLGIDAIKDVEKINQLGTGLEEDARDFIETITVLNFNYKTGETVDDVIQKYEDEEEGYEITDESVLYLLDKACETLAIAVAMKGASKYFSGSTDQLSLINDNNSITEDDFDISFNSEEVKKENILVSRTKLYYQVNQGDDLYSLAIKFYGDYSKFSIIGDANDLVHKDFENGGMEGKNIIIPVFNATESKNSSYNLVYYFRKNVTTPKERQIQILGTDINVTDTRELIVDSNSDLALVYGEDCYAENMMDRLKFPIGSLNPRHPQWGMLVEVGNIPASIFVSRLFDNIEQQVSLDPRTEFVFVDRERSKFEADKVEIWVAYKPVNGNERNINVSDIVAGLLV